MRKFKLIKQFPGSDSLGTIVTGSKETMYSRGLGFRNYDWSHVEIHPEYWEEVTEPDFQIISFSANMWGKGTLATISSNGEYTINPEAEHGWSLKEMLMLGNSVKNGMVQIHSVKRLSDGEIFTIGDRAKTITSKGSHNITQFKIRQRCTGTDANGEYTYDGIDAMWINWEENRGGNWLDSTEKVIQPIFTTEDGVGIFRGDIYWLVDTDFSISMMEALHGCGGYSERKYFSTFELAEDYVIKNAKLISIEDFNNAIASQYGNYNIRQKLIQVAKQRLIKK